MCVYVCICRLTRNASRGAGVMTLFDLEVKRTDENGKIITGSVI